MGNKKATSSRKNAGFSALEELCGVSDNKIAKKVLDGEYDRILRELSYIIKSGKREFLYYNYRLHMLEMNEKTPRYLDYALSKSLDKVNYSNFDIDFSDSEQVKVGICGYSIAHVFHLLKNERKGKY